MLSHQLLFFLHIQCRLLHYTSLVTSICVDLFHLFSCQQCCHDLFTWNAQLILWSLFKKTQAYLALFRKYLITEKIWTHKFAQVWTLNTYFLITVQFLWDLDFHITFPLQFICHPFHLLPLSARGRIPAQKWEYSLTL